MRIEWLLYVLLLHYNAPNMHYNASEEVANLLSVVVREVESQLEIADVTLTLNHSSAVILGQRQGSS